MSWRSEKTSIGQDLVYDGVELGIAPSPSKGTANLQNVNIATETGEVMASYARTAQQQAAIDDGTLTPDGATLLNAPANLKAGQWIKVSASTVTSISASTNPTTASVDYLIVAGGGGGGPADNSGAAGGGGGGEVITGTTSLAAGSYAVTVGDGGAGGKFATSGDNGRGVNGGNSILATVDTATGGGGGGIGISNISPSTGLNGKDGGTGGAGGAGSTGYTGTGGTGTTTGFDGGDGFESATANLRAGGGGAGAGGAGNNGASGVGGDGGAGVSNSITGTATVYGPGGGGGSQGSAGFGPNGAGSGGDNAAGESATANTGGGGGGASTADTTGYVGGDGGSGVVVIAYTTGSMVAYGGVVSYNGGNTIHTFNESGVFTVVGVPDDGVYYVSYASGGKIKLSASFDPTGANPITHGTTGSITFDTVTVPNSMVAKAVEKYNTATTSEYRYYLLDANSYVWVFDTYIYTTYGTTWMLPDPFNYSSMKLTGMSTLNGWLMTVGIAAIYGKPTVNLGGVFSRLDNVYLNEPFATHENFAITGNQGKMYYCDGNYLGELFATTSLVTSIANIQSYCSYTAVTTTGTISAIIAGSLPYSSDGTRIPVVFFTDEYGTLPTAVTAGEVYYLEVIPDNKTFVAYYSLTSTSSIDLQTGAAGNQYFNTFYPFGAMAGVNGTEPLVQWSGQRVNLPANETAQCLVEVGNTVLIGGKSNLIYPWNQIDATPSDFIALPESDVKVMVNVNNMAYVFAGNKGNIYITNNSVASLTMKVPDYCAGVPGTPLTYIEPTFTWGDADYIRGRVYFSILDQTATKAGNTGGVWSFIPSQNIDPSQEVGMALRLENQNSYGDYDGYCTIILPAADQAGTSPQYWTAWQDSYSTATSSFGIDYTATTPVTQFVIETDLLPSGTFLQKGTFQQLEYKLTTQLATGDSVQLYYRTNSTDAWTTCGTVIEETTNKLSGYFEQVFQKTQWLQFRIVVTTPGTTASSFVRLKQLMLR